MTAYTLRQLLKTPDCVRAAPIFDPLSARIAEVVGWQLCKLAGSAGKSANLAVPDEVSISENTDLTDVARRITRLIDIPLVVDADGAGNSVLNIRRTVQDLELAGVAAVEIEDNLVPRRFIERRNNLMIPIDMQVKRLQAAIQARRHGEMLIVGRTTALIERDTNEAVERVQAYAETGVDAIMLPGLGKSGPPDKTALEAVCAATTLPMFVSGLPRQLRHDEEWLRENRVRLQFGGQAAYRMAMKSIADALIHMKEGGEAEELYDRCATVEFVEAVNDVPFLRQWDAVYGHGTAQAPY